MFKKRIMIAVMALAMLILVMSNAVFAAEDQQLTITAGKTEVAVGEEAVTASVPITISNCPGNITTLGFEIDYDSTAMELVSVELSEEEVFAKSYITLGPIEENPTYCFLNETNNGTEVLGGLLATLNFNVKAECPAGVYSVGLSILDNDPDNCMDYDYNKIPVTFVDGSITVKDAYEGKAAKLYSADGVFVAAYDTLQQAIDTATERIEDEAWRTQTIKLLNSVEISETYIWVPLTIDGQGKYDIKLLNGSSLYVNADSTVTFKNMTLSGDNGGQFSLHAYGLICMNLQNNTNSTVVLENVNISGVTSGTGGVITAPNYNGSVTMVNSNISNCVAGWNNFKGGAISLVHGGNFIMDETSSITNCSSDGYEVGVYGGAGSIEINGTISGNVPNGAIYAGDSVNVTLRETANISNNGSKVVVVTDNAAEGSVVNNNTAVEYGRYDNKYYETTIVAVNSNGRVYDDVVKSINDTNNGTVYLLKDAELGAGNLEWKTVTVDGQGHKLTDMATRGCTANVTFKDVTIDLSKLPSNETAFGLWSGSITLDNGAIVNGGGEGCRFVFIDGGNAVGTFTMKEGSVIQNIVYKGNTGEYGAAIKVSGNTTNSANYGVVNIEGGTITGCTSEQAGGAIYVENTGVLNISGGTIKDNKCNWAQGGAIYVASGTVNISGDARITGNEAYMAVNEVEGWYPCNIYASPENINVNGTFTGRIGIRTADTLTAKGQVAKAGTGCSLKSAECVVYDNDGRIAYVSGDKLLLTKKLTLTATTDQGKYKRTGDATKYGVVRVNTMVTEVPETKVTEVGTYFYTVGKDNGLKDNGKNFYKLDVSARDTLTDMGYTADLVDITTDATVFAVNFYKLEGMDGYIFDEPIIVNYVWQTAKNLGTNPGQLN